MPVTFTKIANNIAHVTLHVGEDTVTVVYYPGRVTEKSIAVLNSFAKMDESTLEAGFHDFNKTLATLIKAWDVLEDDGSMFPIDAARLAELPVTFRVQIMSAIMGDIRPETMASQSQN